MHAILSHEAQRRQRLTWPALCDREPRLKQLEQRVLAARMLSKSKFKTVRREVRVALLSLVGWCAASRDLRSSDAWNIALNHLLQPRRLRPSVAARPIAARRCA